MPLGSPHVAILELRDDEDAVSFLDRAERELMRAAQDGTQVISEASCEPDLARA
jgi:hypothetical protein